MLEMVSGWIHAPEFQVRFLVSREGLGEFAWIRGGFRWEEREGSVGGVYKGLQMGWQGVKPRVRLVQRGEEGAKRGSHKAILGETRVVSSRERGRGGGF